jgi:GDPmannose 4,6-dehydratase
VNILIIGSRGQDGTVLRTLYSDNDFVKYGITRDGNTEKSLVLRYDGEREIILGALDFRSPEDVRSWLNRINPSKIFQLATIHGSSNEMASVLTSKEDQLRTLHLSLTQTLCEWTATQAEDKTLMVPLSSQMYSNWGEETIFVDEGTEPDPQNVYAQTKLDAWKICKRFRDDFGVNVTCPILFNHVSPFTKRNFLFPEIANQIESQIKAKEIHLNLRNIHSKMDISSSLEICQAMRAIAHGSITRDYVLGSGNIYTVNEIICNFFATYYPNIPFQLNSKEDHFSSGGLAANTTMFRKDFGWVPEIKPHIILNQLVASRLT